MKCKGVSGSASFNKPATGTIHQKSKISGDKIVRFQNGSNKVAIELSGVQFWSEIILVISNRTRAARSFEIIRMILKSRV